MPDPFIAGTFLQDSGTAVTSRQIPITTAVPLGGMLVVSGNVFGGSAGATVTVTDTKGNTYTTRFVNDVSPTNNRIFAATAAVAAALTTSDTITVTLPSVRATWLLAALAVPNALAYDVTGNANSSGSAPDSGGTASTNAAEMVVGVIGWSGGTVSATPDPLADASTQIHATTAVRHLLVEWTQEDSAGMRDAVATLSASTAWAAGMVALQTVVPSVPPTVAISPNQNVSAGDTVALNASVADDGTITSESWSFLYPTTGAPTITGATSRNATFTAGAAGSLYVVQKSVTDNDGNTVTAITEVRVPSATVKPLPGYAGIGVSGGSVFGGPTSGGTALSDGSDTTGVQLPDATATEQRRVYRLSPGFQPSSGSGSTHAFQSVAGSLTGLVRIFEQTGGTWDNPTLTQRGEYALGTLTTTVQSIPLTLTSGQAATILDGGALWVGFVETT